MADTIKTVGCTCDHPPAPGFLWYGIGLHQFYCALYRGVVRG